MSTPYLIIDGYNLMHAAGLARDRYAPGQLERCRTRLLGYLSAHLRTPERERTTIVFDAASAAPDLPRESQCNGMTIKFALPGRDADETIEGIITGHSSPRQIRLVSSDHRLQKSVRRRRGSFVDSEAFVGELERRSSVSADEPASRGAKPKTDPHAEDWLRIFGGICAADECASNSPSIADVDVPAIQKEIDSEESAPGRRRRRKHG